MLKKCMCVVLAAVLLLGYGAAYAEEYPVDISGIKAAVVIEQNSGTAVIEYNAEEKMDSGGLARLPVLLAVCKKIDGDSIALTDTVTISAAAAKISGPTAFLEAYEQAEMSTLLKAAVMICAGDAIYALAEGVYGSAEACAIAVNELMRDMEIDGNYTDITGNGINFTPHEIAKIGAELMQCQSFTLYSGLFYDTIQHSDGRTTELASSNKLLKSCVGTNGVGTGSSSAAGYCGVFSVKRGNTSYICAIFGAQNSSQRAQKAQSMLEYAFAAYDAKTLATEGEAIVDSMPVHNGTKSNVPIVSNKTVVALVPKNTILEERREIPEILEAPVNSSTVVGTVTYLHEGETVGVVELVSAEDVDRANVFDYIKRSLMEWLHC
ncbi:MAG: D-alanyl-D-alanine carboxypeptidase [Clostridia bacterium]|nr:D-alanyl-D-alanine carboxypeptidase [Clostridia bacterium]